MSKIDFNDLVSHFLVEQEPTQRDPDQAAALATQLATAFDKWGKQVQNDLQNTIWKDQIGTVWNEYIIREGKIYKGKPDANIQKKGLDPYTAKYVDMGHRLFSLLRSNISSKQKEIENLKEFQTLKNFITSNPDSQILQLLQEFTTPIVSYVCKSPWLKSVVDADNLADIALQTVYNLTIYGAIEKFLEKRAGILKARVNKSNILNLLMYPAQYASGTSATPEPLDDSLAKSNMHTERILAVGVAAIEYFKYLINKKISQTNNTEQQGENFNLFNQFANLILNEMANTYRGGEERSAGGLIVPSGTSNQQTQEPAQRSQPDQKPQANYELFNIDVYNPKTWKTDSRFKEFANEYQNFLTTGTSAIIPGKQEEAPSEVTIRGANLPTDPTQTMPKRDTGQLQAYTLDYISKDPSPQAQNIIKALQTIAQFSKTKKTLMQRLGQAAGAIGALSVGMGPVN
jgi:hypothetical protein